MIETVYEHLRQSVSAALENDERFNKNNIEVNVMGDVVILKGVVSSIAEKQALEEDVRKVPGVKTVSNQLTIVGGVDIIVADDQRIRDSITQAFSKSQIDTSDIRIDVNDAVTEIHGAVRTQQEKISISEIAYAAASEVVIINLLGIVPTGDSEDLQLVDRIYATLKNVRDLDIQMIDVKVENKSVTLLGKVPHWNILYACETAVREVQGVADVKNELIMGVF